MKPVSLSILILTMRLFVPSEVVRAADSLSTGTLNVGGFVDTYYACDWTKPPTQDRSFTTQPLRHNEFNINLAMVHVTYDDARTRGRLGLQTGTYVQANAAAEPQLLQHVYEGNAGFRLGGSSWWVDMGMFPSHIGFESAISKDCWTYSRSIMADYSPYYETGIKLSGSLSPRATLGVLVLNGWQNIKETNSDKAVGTQLQLKPIERVLFNWSTFVGNEAPNSAATQMRVFNDLYAQIQATPRLDIALIFDVGVQARLIGSGYASWYAAAWLSRYALTPQVRLGSRLEYYADKEQVIIATGTPRGFQTVGASVNIDYAPTDKLVARLEGRLFNSKDAIYPSPSGPRRASGFVAMSLALSVY